MRGYFHRLDIAWLIRFQARPLKKEPMPMLRTLEIDWSSAEASALLKTGIGPGSALADVIPALERAFLIQSPWASGGRFMAAQARVAGGSASPAVVNVIGGGLSVDQAVRACLGEAVERLSSFDDGHVPLHPVSFAAWREQAPPDVRLLAARIAERHDLDGAALLECVLARRATDHHATPLPAEWCMRRDPAHELLPETDRPRSLGVAAGRSREDAATRAILELVERDALALWWYGARQACALSLEQAELAQGVRFIADLRQGHHARRTWLLDVSSDLAIPCLVAVSVEAGTEDNLCIGAAARLSYGEAIEAALIELCQSEIGNLIARAKQTGGHSRLMTSDDRHTLARAALLKDPACRDRFTAAMPMRIAGGQRPGCYDELVRHLDARGIAVYLVDLDKPAFCLPVVCAIAPELQPCPVGATMLPRRRLEAQGIDADMVLRGTHIV